MNKIISYHKSHAFITTKYEKLKLIKNELTRIFIVRVFPPQFFFSSIFCGEIKKKKIKMPVMRRKTAPNSKQYNSSFNVRPWHLKKKKQCKAVCLCNLHIWFCTVLFVLWDQKSNCHATFRCILLEHIPKISKPLFEHHLHIKTTRSEETRAVSWQSINAEAGRSRKWGKSSCLTKRNSRSIRLMQYPVSHSPPCPRSSTILNQKKKNWGWRDHTIIELSRVVGVASKGEGSTERMET